MAAQDLAGAGMVVDSHTCFERLSRRITQQLAEDIHAGRYQPGDRLPAERELARLMGVT